MCLCTGIHHMFNTLTLYHTVPAFSHPIEKAFSKQGGLRRKCWLPAFSPFPTMFSAHLKKNFRRAYFDVCKCLNVDQSLNLLFGKVNPLPNTSQFY